MVAAQAGGAQFTGEQRVSFSPASDWDPAISAGPQGGVAVTWDTYDKGAYDVYVRTMRYTKAIEMDKPVAAAASENFEARSSAAYDRQGRLWVAYESSAQRWGKDFGVYEKNGVCLYLGHTLRVKCIQGSNAFETAGPLEDALRSAPGLTGREGPPQMAQTNPGMAAATQPATEQFPRMAASGDGRCISLSDGSGRAFRGRNDLSTIFDVVRRLAMEPGDGAPHTEGPCVRQYASDREGLLLVDHRSQGSRRKTVGRSWRRQLTEDNRSRHGRLPAVFKDEAESLPRKAIGPVAT
jgi:hypothetical protein